MKQVRYIDRYRLRKRKRFLGRALLTFIVVISVIGGLVYLFFFSGLFKITMIRYTTTFGSEINPDLKNFVEKKLNERNLWIAERSNIIVFDQEKLQETILEHFPDVDAVDIKKDYFHDLTIHLTERSFKGIWCLSLKNSCFFFDKNGIAYDESPTTSGFLLLHVIDERERQVKLGEKAEEQAWLDAILKARAELTKQGVQINQIIIPHDSFDEFYTITPTGWKVMMSINTDITAQINSMVAFVKRELSQEKLSTLQYIDLRIDGRIYYK